VTATDVRPAVKEQVQSLGREFIAVEDDEFKQAETAPAATPRKCRRTIRPSGLWSPEHIQTQDIVIRRR